MMESLHEPLLYPRESTCENAQTIPAASMTIKAVRVYGLEQSTWQRPENLHLEPQTLN